MPKRLALAGVVAGVVALVVALTLLALWATAAQRSPKPAFAWALAAPATPTQLWVGAEVEVPVTIRNVGGETWTPELGDRLAYHWRSEAGELLVRDGLRTPLPGPVAAGEAVELEARLRSPDEPGRYQLEWAMVREGVRWFPPPEGGPRLHAVEAEQGELRWALRRSLAPESLAPGELVELPVRVVNVGTVPWNGARGDALAYHWWSEEGELLVHEGERTAMPGRFPAGAEFDLDVKVRVPGGRGSSPRRLCLELEPLREGVRWYGPADPSKSWTSAFHCLSVEADPLQWELLADQTPTRMAVGDPELRVAMVLHNSGSEPWLPSDRLSYRWRSLAPGASGALRDGVRTELVEPLEGEASAGVEPGAVIELEARLRPPDQPGEYELVWGLVREGKRWYAAPEGVTRVVEVVRSRLAWGLVHADPLPRIWVNRSAQTTVELQNLGTEPWSEETGDHLSYHWLDAAGEVVEYDGQRTSLPAPVAPGERVTVKAKLRGPEAPGEYRLQWELVREHERWLGPPEGQGAAWHPSQLELVRARWLTVVLMLALALVSVAGALRLRLYPPLGARARALVEQLPLVWAGFSIWILAAAFHDFSAIEAWPGAAFITASGAWLLVAWLAFARYRVRAWLAAVLVTGLAALALADLVYMHYFGSIVPVVALTASHHLGEVGDSALAELDQGWAWLAVLPLSGLLAASLWPSPTATGRPTPRAERRELVEVLAELRRPPVGRIRPSPPRRPKPAPTGWRRAWAVLGPRLAAFGVCLALASPAVIRLGVALNGELGVRVFSEQAMVGRFGYLNAHLFDLARTLRERGRRGQPSLAELERIHAWFNAHAEALDAGLDPSSTNAPAPGVAAGHNLLLLQVEALQTWVIGLEVEGQAVTPLLNRLQHEADWYPYLIDQTNQGKTSDAEYAVLNSQHPLGEGSICFLRADNHFYTLAHVLAQQGYATLSAHPYKRGFWNRAVLHPRYGFERSMFRRELGEGQAIGWGLADGLFFERMVPALLDLPEPWFGFLITLSLHHPYDEFPATLAQLELGALAGTRVGNYLQAMNYFDRSLAQLLAQLDQAGALDHTVVALYGDHDARFELDEYPEVLALAGFEDWDPAAFARLERVPLFVRVPPSTRPARGRVERVGGQVDIAPTLLHTLGVARPRTFIGRPLLPGAGLEDFAAYPDGSAYARDRMYVASGRGIPRKGGCFDFPTGGSRPLEDCAELAKRAAAELEISRAIVDHDLHRALADEPGVH